MPATGRRDRGSRRPRRARSRRRTSAGSTARPRPGPRISLAELLQQLLGVGGRLGVRVLLDDLAQGGLGLVRLLQVVLHAGLREQVGRGALRVGPGLRLVLGRLLLLLLRLVLGLRLVLLGDLLGGGRPGPFLIAALLRVGRQVDCPLLLVARLG